MIETEPAAGIGTPNPLLDVQNLSVFIGSLRIVEGVSLVLKPGERLGIVGESGSGKSMTALALMNLLPTGGRITADRLTLMGEDLLTASPSRFEQLRGSAMGMIFQEPMTALNPVLTIGEQIIETVRRHEKIGRREARNRSIEALRRVGIPSPEKRIDDYPHRLSGGMRQRVMISMALICRPKLLIADEPTTALDATIQAQILNLMLDLQDEYGMGIVFISHDLQVVSAFAERVMIMYLGRVVEEATAATLFQAPRHPYTEGLLNSVPPIDRDVDRLAAIEGSVPPINELPPGCRFAPRCTYARPECDSALPPLIQVGEDHHAACIRNTGYQFRELMP
jgi:oligopeptide/dipeptide ABC transporter ATP-binding protein